MSDSPAAILFDVQGNPIKVILDAGEYRLGVESRNKCSTIATRTSVNSTASDTLILAANPDRLGLILYNNSNSPLHIGFGSTPASLTDFTLIISAQTIQDTFHDWCGEIRGIWEAANGVVYITELT